MKLGTRLAMLLAIAILALSCWVSPGLAQGADGSIVPPATQTNPPSFWNQLEQLRHDSQLQDLVEDDIKRSLAIRAQIQAEVDRAFDHTTTLLNVLLAVLTALPVLAAVSIWFIRRSVINQIIAETKRQLQDEVENQLEAEVAAELKRQAEAFQKRIEQLEAEFDSQLSQLKLLFSDAQKGKDQIIQELAQIVPSPMREAAPPETQKRIHALTQQLEQLKSTNAQLSFTASDYVGQGNALYFDNRFEEAIASYDKAIQMEPDSAKAWFSRGAALAKLQQYEEAIAAYDRATQLKPDVAEAWFGQGIAQAKLQQLEAAVLSYDRATQLKPDLVLAWIGKARCYALQGNHEAAWEDLQQAIGLNPDKAWEIVKTDPVFEVLRDRISPCN